MGVKKYVMVKEKDMEIEKMNKKCGDSDFQEYRKRWSNGLDGKELSNMCDEDIDVFRRMNEEVVKVETTLGETYVYLTMGLYREMEVAAKSGMSNNQVRAFCGIGSGKWKKLLEKYPLLRDRLDDWRDNLAGKAVMNVAKKITEEGDIKTSQWYLERKDRENFGKGLDVNVKKSVDVRHSLDMTQMKELRNNLKAIKDAQSGDEAEVIDV